MIQWLKNQMLGLAMATAKVEKNALNNHGNNLTDDAGYHHTVKKDSVSQDLINGVVTKEVENLRWRYYKVLQESEKYDRRRRWVPEMNDYVYDTGSDEQMLRSRLNKIKTDPFDAFPLQYVITNTETANSWSSRADKESNFIKKIEFEYNSQNRFKLEDFLTQVFVRDVGNGQKMCELYFHKYHDGYSAIHTMFINELARMHANKSFNSMFDIKRVGWVTDKADLGVFSNKGFLYYIERYDKIVEFNGSYIVKFIVKPEFENFDIFEKYRVEELDKKYQNGERRSNTLG